MKPSDLPHHWPHHWDVSPTEAVKIQHELRKQIRLVPLERPVKLVAGADISFNRFSDIMYAGFVILEFPSLRVVERASAVVESKFPYIPGLLTFREARPLIEAWKRIHHKPDVVIFDGQGIAHPRRLGIATHMGIVLEVPSIGCGKSKLCGHFEDLAQGAGSTAPLVDRGEQVGVALRTKKSVNPVFVSPGHLITLREAVEIVLQTRGQYRIPEPTRQAHLFVNDLRREALLQGVA